MGNFRIYEFHPQVYPRRLWVAVGGNEKDLMALFKVSNGAELEPDICRDCLAVTQSVMTNNEHKYLGELIWFPTTKEMTTNNIAHESAHAALDIFGFVGCKVHYDNQEPIAYLVGWVADCIDKVKRNKVE